MQVFTFNGYTTRRPELEGTMIRVPLCTPEERARMRRNDWLCFIGFSLLSVGMLTGLAYGLSLLGISFYDSMPVIGYLNFWVIVFLWVQYLFVPFGAKDL